MTSTLREAVGQVLDGLPARPDDVAALLEADRCTGWVRHPQRCPLAEHVLRSLDGRRVHRVLVGAVGIAVWADGETAMMALPDTVATFVRALDDLAYPALHWRVGDRQS